MRERPAGCATDREVVVVAAVLDAGSEKAAAHRLGLSHSTVKHHLANARSKVGAETTAQLVWILAPRLPEPEGVAETDDQELGRVADELFIAGSECAARPAVRGQALVERLPITSRAMPMTAIAPSAAMTMLVKFTPVMSPSPRIW